MTERNCYRQGRSQLTTGHRAGGQIATTLAVVAASVAARSARADDWGTPGLDIEHTRLSTERSGAAFGDGSWMAVAPNWTLASPVVEDGFLVTADADGVVSALRADSGEVVWRVSLGSGVQGTPALARGRVFVPTVGNMLVALRLADGGMLWMRDTGGMTYSSPAPLDGDVIVAPGLPQLNVMRLSGETGAIIWQSASVMWQFSNTSPAIGGGLAVFGSQQGHYYAFDVATGALRWEYVADGTVNMAAPIILGGRVYMAGGDQSNNVHAVDAVTGKAIAGWPIALPTPAPDIAGTRQGGWRAVSSFTAAGGLLLLQTRLDDALGPRASGPFDWLSREIVVALNPSSGALVWQHALARAENMDVNNVPKFFVCPTPAAYGTDSGSPLIAVASSLNPVVAMLDVASGSERTHYALAGAALASPALANGRLYTTAINGTTQAFASTSNHAPAAPVPANYTVAIDLSNPMLGWSAAVDPDGETTSYELRIDADGEILESWLQETQVSSGMTSARLAPQIVPGPTYTFAVRARDPHGALSPWSASSTFTVTGAPPPIGNPPPPPMGNPPPPMTGNPPPSMDGGVPQIAITKPSSPDGSSNPPAEQAMAGMGCSIGGRSGEGWATAIVLLALVAFRARRRKSAR